MLTYLEPMFDPHKSFYRKASVETKLLSDKTMSTILRSYETPVVMVKSFLDGRILVDFHNRANYSRTTRRHVLDFLKQYGIPGFLTALEKLRNDLKLRSFPDFINRFESFCFHEKTSQIVFFDKNCNPTVVNV